MHSILHLMVLLKPNNIFRKIRYHLSLQIKLELEKSVSTHIFTKKSYVILWIWLKDEPFTSGNYLRHKEWQASQISFYVKLFHRSISRIKLLFHIKHFYILHLLTKYKVLSHSYSRTTLCLKFKTANTYKFEDSKLFF